MTAVLFGAKVYKISEDGGSRLTFMKITGGCLKVRDLVDYTSADGESFSEKVSRIRIYSGAKYRNADNAETGIVCAVEGLTKTYAGQGFGFEQDSAKPLLEPVLTYRVSLCVIWICTLCCRISVCLKMKIHSFTSIGMNSLAKYMSV